MPDEADAKKILPAWILLLIVLVIVIIFMIWFFYVYVYPTVEQWGWGGNRNVTVADYMDTQDARELLREYETIDGGYVFFKICKGMTVPITNCDVELAFINGWRIRPYAWIKDDATPVDERLANPVDFIDVGSLIEKSSQTTRDPPAFYIRWSTYEDFYKPLVDSLKQPKSNLYEEGIQNIIDFINHNAVNLNLQIERRYGKLEEGKSFVSAADAAELKLNAIIYKNQLTAAGTSQPTTAGGTAQPTTVQAAQPATAAGTAQPNSKNEIIQFTQDYYKFSRLYDERDVDFLAVKNKRLNLLFAVTRLDTNLITEKRLDGAVVYNNLNANAINGAATARKYVFIHSTSPQVLFNSKQYVSSVVIGNVGDNFAERSRSMRARIIGNAGNSFANTAILGKFVIEGNAGTNLGEGMSSEVVSEGIAGSGIGRLMYGKITFSTWDNEQEISSNLPRERNIVQILTGGEVWMGSKRIYPEKHPWEEAGYISPIFLLDLETTYNSDVYFVFYNGRWYSMGVGVGDTRVNGRVQVSRNQKWCNVNDAQAPLQTRGTQEGLAIRNFPQGAGYLRGVEYLLRTLVNGDEIQIFREGSPVATITKGDIENTDNSIQEENIKGKLNEIIQSWSRTPNPSDNLFRLDNGRNIISAQLCSR